MPQRNAAILSVGDELTLGQNLDTNSQWLSARLAEHSVFTIEHRTVADDRTNLAAAIREMAHAADLHIITGGLGPTADDLTREALGDVVTPGQQLIEDPTAAAHVRSLFEKRGRIMSPLNARQA